MKRLVSNKSGREIYGPKFQNIESSSDSEIESDDDRHSPPAAAGSTVSAQISGIKHAKQQSPTITRGKRVGCNKDGEFMYRAALKGDWVAAEVLLERDPNLAIDYITEEGDRALHVATAMKHNDFVEKLVERVSEKDLALLDGRGYTACCYAAVSGVVEIARFMIEKNRNLVTAHDEENLIPLCKAALRGNKDMLSYLLRSTESEDLSKEEWFDVLLVTIRGQMYDMAIEIMGKDGSIAMMVNEEGLTALHLLARQKIPNISRRYSPLIYVLMDYIVDDGNFKNEPPEFSKLLEKLWAEMQKMEKGRLLELIRKPHIVHDAAKAGNVELVIMLISAYPQLIWDTDSNGYTIFHIAVIYRQSDVFNLIHQVEAMIGFTTMSRDEKGNNILHLAAKPAALNKRKLPPALQMRSELLWFKAVERIVPPSCVMMENNQGLKPRELFSKKHKRLLKESELWMRNTADSCMLIATILLTVVFAAAFTVPGGYGSQTGEPILAKKHWFKVFLVFEVLGFIGSVVSIVMFRSIMASRFAEEDFLSKLPILQMVGFQALVMSLAGAFSAFMSSILLFNLDIKGLVWFGFFSLYLFGSLWIGEEFGAVYRDIVLKNSIYSSKHTLFNQNPTGKSKTWLKLCFAR